jgi:hypothetical protein
MYIGSTAHLLTESRLSMVLLETPENAQIHVTFLALQLQQTCNISAYSAFVNICDIFYNTPVMLLSTVNTNSNASDSDKIQLEVKAILSAIYKLLYSVISSFQEIIRNRIRRMIDTKISQTIDISSWDTIYIQMFHFSFC